MKYLFIDSNQYKNIFSSNEQFSDEILELLLKLNMNDKLKLVIPRQVIDEVERNRDNKWCEFERNKLKNKITTFDNLINELNRKIGSNEDYRKELSSLEGKIKKQKNKIKGELKKVDSKYYKLQSKQNQKLKKIFKNAAILEENEEILRDAYFRFLKHNPPYDSTAEDKNDYENSKFGDCIIWETLLSHFRKKENKSSDLIFIAKDHTAWGKSKFNNWLLKEFKIATNGNIVYGQSISDIMDLTKEEQRKLKKLEASELKEDAISSFLLGGAYAFIGRKILKIAEFKESLNLSDYERICRGALSNPDIYKSIYAPYAFKILLEDPNNVGYVLPIIEKVDYELWDRFSKRFDLELKRQGDEIPEINLDDEIPKINLDDEIPKINLNDEIPKINLDDEIPVINLD